MKRVTNAYKEAMNSQLRDRAYISVGIGIINQDAQVNASADGDFIYFSNGNIFDENIRTVDYGTFEQNYVKADGKMLFAPEVEPIMQLQATGIVTSEPYQPVRIDFNDYYSIKGLTIDFSECYPTSYRVETENANLTYSNDSQRHILTDVLGDTRYIIITPLQMREESQRFRIKSILMGVGLSYTNSNIESFNRTETVSPISHELPQEKMNLTFFDEKKQFVVEDVTSFVGFLEVMQRINVSFGITLADGTVEWHQTATNYLSDWSVKDNKVSLTATDRLSRLEDEYSLGFRIYDRTAYSELQSIFQEAGLEPDEYEIDDYLQDITLHNPLPVTAQKECIQLIANLCRCMVRQDEFGKIIVKANFANVLDPSELVLSNNGTTEWSKPNNILVGGNNAYAEFNQDFIPVSGNTDIYFMPENGEPLLETGYVSAEIADENGLFAVNPVIAVEFPASYTYYCLHLDFKGNAPKRVNVRTYNENVLVDSVVFDNLEINANLFSEYYNFNKMEIEFIETVPHNRILVDKLSFGELSDYVLTRSNMIGKPTGFKENRVKSVKVKIFTYVLDEEGKPKEVEDDVYFTKQINDVGEIKYITNPLVDSQEKAEILANWLANYYGNNICYDVDFRGEPRIDATDIIHMDSEVLNNMQVEVISNTLNYRQGFSGKLELRKATRIVNV